jgi:hypothetical protein
MEENLYISWKSHYIVLWKIFKIQIHAYIFCIKIHHFISSNHMEKKNLKKKLQSYKKKKFKMYLGAFSLPRALTALACKNSKRARI